MDWMIVASKLYAALKSVKLVHAPGCDANECAVCKQGYEACQEFSKLQEREQDSLAQKRY